MLFEDQETEDLEYLRAQSECEGGTWNVFDHHQVIV